MLLLERITELLREQIVLQLKARMGAPPLWQVNIALIELAMTLLLARDLTRLF
jgi:hypothetical protein